MYIYIYIYMYICIYTGQGARGLPGQAGRGCPGGASRLAGLETVGTPLRAGIRACVHIMHTRVHACYEYAFTYP